jgi:hypothetical protein
VLFSQAAACAAYKVLLILSRRLTVITECTNAAAAAQSHLLKVTVTLRNLLLLGSVTISGIAGCQSTVLWVTPLFSRELLVDTGVFNRQMSAIQMNSRRVSALIVIAVFRSSKTQLVQGYRVPAVITAAIMAPTAH